MGRSAGRRTPISRIGVIGCGRRFTSAISPALQALGVRASLVVDPDLEARESAVRALGDSTTVTAGSLDDMMLANVTAQALVIASPSGLHFEHAALALAMGLPAFVEKPLACAPGEIASLRSSGDHLLGVAEPRIYRRDLRLLRSFIRSGLIGEIEWLSYRDSVIPPADFGSSWRNDPALAGGGVLLDLGCHTIAVIQWLLGRSIQDFSILSAHVGRADLRVDTHALITCASARTSIEIDVRLCISEPREVLIVTGNLGTARVERDKLDGGTAVVTIVTSSSGTRKRELIIGDRYDSMPLRMFILGASSTATLDRHAATIGFIANAYRHISGAEEAWRR